MEIDQIIFKKFVRFFKSSRKVDSSILERTVKLGDLSDQLTLIARALTAAPIEIVESEREGGWKDNLFFLPDEMSFFEKIEDNILFYSYRIFYLSIQKKLNLNWNINGNFSIDTSQLRAKETAPLVLRELFEEYGKLEGIHHQLHDALPLQSMSDDAPQRDTSWLYGRWMKNSQLSSSADVLKNINSPTGSAVEKQEITTEIKAKKADEIQVVQVDKRAQEEYTLTHNFEKVETIDEHNGIWRDFDGDDNLKEEADALEEFNLNKVVRVDDPVHSVYKADFLANSNIAESTEVEEKGYCISYDEWDYAANRYKENYCKVYHRKLLKSTPDYFLKTVEQNRALLLQLKKNFDQINNERKKIRRLSSGDVIDVDTVIDMCSDIAAGQTPDDRVYSSKRRREKELSILFLLDMSLSSDGYSKGNRIIDVEKQVSILFGEVLNEFGVDFQIDGFSSKTRNHTDYTTLKSFNESWNATKKRIGTIQPNGYTRIGSALRGMLPHYCLAEVVLKNG